MKLSDAEIISLLFDEQASDPATPATGLRRLYVKSDGLYLIDDAGTVVGPFGAGGAGAVATARVIKAADESVTSSTTLQNDDDLLFAIAASETWVGSIVLFYEGPTAADIKLAFTFPAGATARYGAIAIGDASTDGFGGDTVRSGSTTSGAIGFGSVTGPVHVMRVEFAIVNSTTPGTVNFQWAQNTSNGTPVTVKAKSHLLATRIS